jgi:hypothetical protein
VLNVNGMRLVNTWRPTAIKAVKGDVRPFINYLRHLVPVRSDRRELLRWCTTLVARPELRMRYSVLLVSNTQGIGKTTLGQDILAPLIGPWNASYPNEHTILTSAHNTWMAHKRLAQVSEIYSGQSRKCYDRLKDVVTDGTVDCNPIFIPVYTIENWLHVLACSNSERALHLDDVDRRWLVPLMTELVLTKEYWQGFHTWLRTGGLGHIKWWLDERAKQPKNLVSAGERAPITARKQEIIAEGRSFGQQRAMDLGSMVAAMNKPDPDQPAKPLRKIVLAVSDVVQWVADLHYAGWT